MKRRNSKNLTFEDMMKYHTLIADADEAYRLRQLTDNDSIYRVLSAFACKRRSELASWLDEEV